MPFYDYFCNACNHQWEEMHKVGEEPTYCPKCDSVNIDRKFPTPRIGGASPIPDVSRPPGGRIFSGPHASSKTTEH